MALHPSVLTWLNRTRHCNILEKINTEKKKEIIKKKKPTHTTTFKTVIYTCIIFLYENCPDVRI